jgi:thiamine biosynthesis lipoprotein
MASKPELCEVPVAEPMEALNAAQFFCPKCSAEVPAEAAVCPHCGASLAAPAPPERRDMLDNPWVVLGMLFLATGVLGLPFLWRSRGFSPMAKVVVGVAVTIYTALLVGLAVLAVMWAWRNAQPALGQRALPYNQNMTRKASRRDFLKGQSAHDALEDAGERLVGNQPTETPQAKKSEVAARDPASRSEAPSYLMELSRRAMACDFEISLNAGQHSRAPEAAVAALDLIDQLEAQLTVYRANSEISQINRRAAFETVPVELHLHGLLQQARELSEQTGGAFDITAGPLVKLWGQCRKEGRLPAADEIDRIRERVNWRHVELDGRQSTVRFCREGVEINLGAIGKGYALDRASRVLRDSGVEVFLFHGGRSSLIAFGSRAGAGEGGGWRVAIRHPLRPDRPIGEVRLIDRGMGTSGSGTQFFTHRGKRYGHILDPRSGWPVEGMLSTTVLAPTAADADALSTAFYVMGVEPSLEHCRKHPEVSAILIAAGERPGAVALYTANLDESQWAPAS